MNLPVAPESDPRFSGTERLLGRRALERLRQSRVCVIGVGGVGGWAAEGLARAGVGSLTLVDLDEICLSNLNRQVHALDHTVGRAKVEAMAERLRGISPALRVDCHPIFFNADTAELILGPKPDLVVDCIDSIPHKCLLLAECRRRGLRIVTVGAAGGRADPTRIQVTDLAISAADALLSRLRKKLRQNFGFPRDPRILWDIPAVYSDEPPRDPRRGEAAGEGGLRLDCASGYGTAGYVTGTFGFAAAAAAVETLLRKPPAAIL